MADKINSNISDRESKSTSGINTPQGPQPSVDAASHESNGALEAILEKIKEGFSNKNTEQFNTSFYQLLEMIYDLEQRQPSDYKRTIKKIGDASNQQIDYKTNQSCMRMNKAFNTYTQGHFSKACDEIITEVSKLQATQLNTSAGNFTSDFTFESILRACGPDASFFQSRQSRGSDVKSSHQEYESEENTFTCSNAGPRPTGD